MRVALVSPYALAVPGGVQAHVVDLAGALRRDGHDVVLVSPGRGEQRLGGDLGAVGGPVARVGVGRKIAVPFNGSVAPIAVSPLAAVATRRALASIAPDVVHVHEPLVPAVGIAAATSDVAPTVATFHAWSDTDRLYRAARPAARRVTRHLAARLAVSEAAATYHGGAIGVPASSFRIVPNGVDVAHYAAAEPFPELVDPERPALLFVGRLERRKGLEPLVRAFTRLKAERPEVRLFVVGEGPERDRCQALLPARLRSDVVFLGRVAHDDKARFFASCDLFVAPALGGESFGIVLLEAMAAGRPVVASDLPGYRSVVRDGLQGHLVPPNDPAALAATIGALLDNPALGRAMAEEGGRTAAAHDWSVVGRTAAAIYAEVTATT